MKTIEAATPRRPKIVVVGSVNIDLVVRCSRLPRPGETLKAMGFSQVPGGKGANQAVAAARLGADVTMVGRLGDDGFGETLLSGLVSEGINVDCVLRSHGISSGLAMVTVDDSGQNQIIVVPGANGLVTSADILAAESAIASADVLLLQFEIPLSAVRTAIELAVRHRVRIVLDPAPALSDVADDLLHRNVLCPNETEAESLTGLTITSVADALAAAEMLRDRGATLSIVTLGANGVAFCNQGSPARWLPPFAVHAVDTTAAGDAFAGALAFALAEGQNSADAIRFASSAGALAATLHGAQPAMPDRTAVEQLMSEQVLPTAISNK